MARKTYIIQAMDDAGGMLLDVRVDTRAAEKLALREGFHACGRNGGGWVRRQTLGATGRAVQEVFGPCPALAPILAETYEVVAITDWLHRVNMNARRACA